jgi:hypothetical protein
MSLLTLAVAIVVGMSIFLLCGRLIGWVHQRSFWKIYQEDIRLFFGRHPVAQVVYTFSLYFTYWSLFELFTSWIFPPPRSYRSYVIGAAFFATFATIFVLIDQRWRRRRSSTHSGDTKSVT